MSAPESIASYTVWSNIGYPLACVALWWRGWAWHYYAQLASILLVFWHSSYYHLCWTDNSQYCPGPYGAHDISQALDVYSACQALNAMSVVLDQFWFRRWSNREWGRKALGAWYCVIALTVAITFQYDGAGMTTVGIVGGLTALGALWAFGSELVRLVRTRERATASVWWWCVRLVGVLACWTGAVVCYYEDQVVYDSTVYEQSSEYDALHGSWHLLGALGTALAFTLLEQRSVLTAYTLVRTATPRKK